MRKTDNNIETNIDKRLAAVETKQEEEVIPKFETIYTRINRLEMWKHELLTHFE